MIDYGIVYTSGITVKIGDTFRMGPSDPGMGGYTVREYDGTMIHRKRMNQTFAAPDIECDGHRVAVVAGIENYDDGTTRNCRVSFLDEIPYRSPQGNEFWIAADFLLPDYPPVTDDEVQDAIASILGAS